MCSPLEMVWIAGTQRAQLYFLLILYFNDRESVLFFILLLIQWCYKLFRFNLRLNLNSLTSCGKHDCLLSSHPYARLQPRNTIPSSALECVYPCEHLSGSVFKSASLLPCWWWCFITLISYSKFQALLSLAWPPVLRHLFPFTNHML